MRIECQNVHVRVGVSKVCSMGKKSRVVVDDVLTVEGCDSRADVVRGALKRRQGNEEIGATKVVVICILLCLEVLSGHIMRSNRPRHTTAPNRDCISSCQKALKSS